MNGLEVYLESWELAAGQEFQQSLAQGLRESKTCVVFLGPNGLGPWQKQELQVAIDRRLRDEAFHVIPVLLPGVERPRRGDVAHLEFLVNASWVEFLRTLDDDRAFRSLVRGITGKKPTEPNSIPHAGCARIAAWKRSDRTMLNSFSLKSGSGGMRPKARSAPPTTPWHAPERYARTRRSPGTAATSPARSPDADATTTAATTRTPPAC